MRNKDCEKYPKNLKYTKTHEWLKIEERKITLGISYFAQEQLGDIVYVELPKIGMEVKEQKMFMEIESSKAVSKIYSPCKGKIVAINKKLGENPGLINSDPYGEGWLVEIEIMSLVLPDTLLDSICYENFLKEEIKDD
ncbi:MAG: glycine cleavage system protein H [Parcubacteria group bacterium CG11_big_fil_rev_8_21_14_0_20_39_14]|nr:MAG: glycine cleavage system protein H [Parcubacteria group bacterium CG11_big_fil_rev_8_21_14_0_20_39_14]PIS35174.1 MAG: glycine cleavage system protein H [Parcubacteria group bacterium CG08_land_8_20_14_0_20_38_56]